MPDQRFSALLPHEKTEMALLLQERLTVEGARRVYGEAIAAHAGKTHAYVLPFADGGAQVLEDVAAKVTGEAGCKGVWTRLASSVLLAIHEAHDGVLKANKSEIAARFGASATAVERTMGGLIRDGLVRRWGKSSHWALTDLGRKLVAELEARAAQ
ncbi:hypothetical protein J5N58_06850 [Rhizobium cremeum]|uniref:hypothetical protein n=1 Tax=Rhizobium cremeum TaxID=2813827 RepID=UPI001FCFF96F|nr:hypothetical protein [Rhizobium cremeum]MCJ7996669.1 hypothetical protein [Rhizobium cremeum]MCJ7999393.1 hypothetical protein [Rhizobium cremeum]